MKKETKSYLVFGVVLLISIIATSLLTNQFLYKTKILPYQDKIDTLSSEKDTLLSEKSNLQSQIIEKDSKLENNEIFIEEYSIVLTNIHVAMSSLGLSMANLQAAQDYTITGQYYYDSAKPLYDEGKEQALEAKELLGKAKVKINKIQNKSPNSFFEQDIKNRIEQIDVLLLVENSYYNLLDYNFKELYEINYGSEVKAKEYFDKYNAETKEYNSIRVVLGKVQDKIDAEWDQDWYPPISTTI